MKPALLIIDMQHGLLHGAVRPFDSRGLIRRINGLARAARAARAPVIWIQHEDAGRLQKGSADWAVCHETKVEPGDLTLAKTTPDSFCRTDLNAQLKSRGVDTLIVCGMHTEFCVDTTCRSALALGWPVLLAQDAHSTGGNAVLQPEQIIAHHNATLSAIRSFGPRVQTWPTAALLRALAKVTE